MAYARRAKTGPDKQAGAPAPAGNTQQQVEDLDNSMVIAILEAGAAGDVEASVQAPVGQAEDDEYEVKRHAGNPFIRGEGDAGRVAQNDVNQGSLGDCYLMAGMAAVAKANPKAIESLIKPLGEGRYEVTLYTSASSGFLGFGGPGSVKVIVDDQFPTKTAGHPAYARPGDKDGEQTELWGMLLEKAYAKHTGDYGAIEGGHPGNAMRMFNRYKDYRDFVLSSETDDKIAEVVSQALANNQAVTAFTPSSWSDEQKALADSLPGAVVTNHAYAIDEINGDEITLYNPWGSRHPKMKISEFRNLYRKLSVQEK